MLLALGALWLLFMPGHSLLSWHRLERQVADLTRENRVLQQRNTQLAAEVRRLQQDDRAIEEVARKKYGFLKKNETVYEFGAARPGKKKSK